MFGVVSLPFPSVGRSDAQVALPIVWSIPKVLQFALGVEADAEMNLVCRTGWCRCAAKNLRLFLSDGAAEGEQRDSKLHPC